VLLTFCKINFTPSGKSGGLRVATSGAAVESSGGHQLSRPHNQEVSGGNTTFHQQKGGHLLRRSTMHRFENSEKYTELLMLKAPSSFKTDINSLVSILFLLGHYLLNLN
jgi:hypothetical protein